MKPFIVTLFTLILALSSNSYSQTRVAVLPIRNSDGTLALNTYCYKIADSPRSALSLNAQNGKQFYIVPSDSVEAVLAELNLDPNNMQYESDLWKSVAKLGCEYVITGNFLVNGGRMLLNVYCYKVSTKMYDRTNCAVNLFKAPERILETIPIVCNRLLPAFTPK